MVFSRKYSDIPSLNRSRIYNFASNKKPAELFRKDLISAMKISDSEQLNKDDYWLILDTWKPEWEKGVQVPVNLESLNTNKLSYRKLNIKEKNDYKIPKNFIKFDMNPDFYVANYDLDLFDLCWLKCLEESEENIIISEDLLASVITQFEIECAAKMNEKKDKGAFDDHVLCDVCKSPDGEDNNEMVYCDSCNICVHQACYGIKEIPSGDWFCSPCKELGSKKNVVCVLCPNIGGAFKPTTNAGQWSHVSCALWVPEISIGDVELMEPITKIDSIPSTRWNLLCSLCNIKQGTPIQCSEKGCKVSYHVTCAFNHKLKMKAIIEKNKTGVKLKSFCNKHSDKRKKIELNNSSIQEIDLVINSDSSLENSNLEFWQYIDLKSMSKQLLTLIKNDYPSISQKCQEFYLDLMFQYWKIKRYSQLGAPLIKITTSASIEEMQLNQRMEILRLRVDFERVRNLTYLLARREKLKKYWLNAHKNAVNKSLEIAERLNEENNLKPKLISKPESPIHTKELQKKLRTLEDLNAIHETVDIYNIYDRSSCEINKLKLILKRLNTLTKIEKTNELLKKSKSNPYARSYLFSKREQNMNKIDNSSNQTSTKLLPLKSKLIPSNLKNSTHHLKTTEKLTEINNSKIFDSSRKHILRKNIKPQSDSKLHRKSRFSSRISPRKIETEKKAKNFSTQENYSKKKSISKKLDFNLDLSKKNSLLNVHRKIILTRSHFNSSIQKICQ